MTTFGFSAFLKLLSLNGRLQRAEIARRVGPRDGPGYDFHRAMRRICGQYLSGSCDLAGALDLAKSIAKESERKSAVNAIEKLDAWRTSMGGETFTLPGKIYETTNGVFKVRYEPDFGIKIAGQRVAVHLWNTIRPPLDARMSRAALSLFLDSYEKERLDDLTVLDLRTKRFIRLSEDRSAALLGANIVTALEAIFEDMRPRGPRPGAEDRPHP